MNRLPALVGAAIFVGALLLRLVGVSWGLKNDLHNQSYHPDELPIFKMSQLIEPAKGSFTPHVYNYGSLYLTVLRVASDVTTAYTGAPDKTEDSNWAWVSRCHLAGRIFNCIAAAATALLVFLMMRRFTTLLGAGLSGAVIAVAPAFVEHSRFQTVDVLATFLIAASAYCALLLLPPSSIPPTPNSKVDDSPGADQEAGAVQDLAIEQSSNQVTGLAGQDLEPISFKLGLKYAGLSGLFAGLSAGTKYSGIVAIFTLYTVVLLAKRRKGLIEAVVGTATLVAGFILATPGFLLDHDKFMEDFNFEVQHVATGHGYAFQGTPSGFIFHLVNLQLGLGGILALCCLVGLIWAAVKRNVWALALMAFFIPYYFVIGKAEVKFIRYTFPLYVGLAAGFGWAMAECEKHKQGIGKFGVALGICGLGGLDPGGLRQAATITAQMVQEDPRDSAARYIRSVATPSTRVGFARDSWYWSVPLEKDGILPPFVPLTQRLDQLRTETTPPVAFVLSADGSPTIFDPSLLTKLKPELVAYTSIESWDLVRLHDLKGLPDDVKVVADQTDQFMKVLDQTYTTDRVFGTGGLPVEDMSYINPQVYVWKRKATH